MMLSIVLYTISISILGFQFVNAAECPEGFDKFKRIPTERNNHTSDYCLKMVIGDPDYIEFDKTNRDCAAIGAELTTVENKKELDFVAGYSRLYGTEIAVDGFLNEGCLINSKNKVGKQDCVKTKQLYLLTNKNTDPTFIFSKFEPKPDKREFVIEAAKPWTVEDDKKLGCLYIRGTHYKPNRPHSERAVFDNFECNEERDLKAVLCGKKI